MTELRINNSYSQIKGLTSLLHKKLRDILNYDIDASAAYFSKNYFNTKKYLLDNKGFFPTGLLHLVMKFTAENALECSIIDDRIKPTKHVPIKGTYPHAAYGAQMDAVLAASKRYQGTISMCTGSGKSMVIALLIDYFKIKTLVVVPNLELKKQLTETLKEIFGSLEHITIENIDSAALQVQGNYDLLIIDEAHHSASKTYQLLNKKFWNNIYCRFFLTATPFRNNKNEMMLFEAIAGKVIYELSYKEAVKKGYVVPVDAFYVELPKVDTNAYTWAEVYSELVVNSTGRNVKIAALLGKFREQQFSVLCLVKEIRHGEILSELANIPFANGQDEDSRGFINLFNQKKIDMLIGTTGIIGEGVDTKPCEICVIAGLGKAKSAFMQQVGRAIRTYPGKETAKIIIFKDKSHKFTLRHFNEQKKILLEAYGVDVIKLDV